jgi:hypothetical protein
MDIPNIIIGLMLNYFQNIFLKRTKVRVHCLYNQSIGPIVTDNSSGSDLDLIETGRTKIFRSHIPTSALDATRCRGSGEQLIKEREREVAPVTFGNDRKTGRLRHCT